jgi:hypothetical protein
MELSISAGCAGTSGPKEYVLSTKDDPFERREYEERLRFEELLADIPARFINLPSSQVDA